MKTTRRYSTCSVAEALGSALADDELLAQFEARTLPFERWTHRCHVKVGYLYLRDVSFQEALKKMRAGIQAYNAANADRVRMGYHETITVAFLHLIGEAVARSGDGTELSADAFCDASPELMDRAILHRFYSLEVLLSPAARVLFVEPDRMSLPAPFRA